MSDSDPEVDDILNDLLANGEDDPAPADPPQKVLKELDYNFLEKIDEPEGKPEPLSKDSSLIPDLSDSSDEEDKKYFEDQKYSDSGRNIKQLLKHQEIQKKDSHEFNSATKPLPKAKSGINDSWPSSPFEKPAKPAPKPHPKTGLTTWLKNPVDCTTDPIFGLRLIKPLVSSAELKQRMEDRKAVTVSKVRHFLATCDASEDWVIAGVLIHRSSTRKSQNGNQYCIWQLSDLSENIPSVSLFLFSGAYKQFWKTSEGSVIGILNPSVMESRSDKSEATLSVDNAQKIMILGSSRDLGRCKSMKKSGEACTNIVNTNRCEYCIYHVKHEYSKASRRADLQTDKNNRRFGNSFGKTQNSMSIGNGLNQLNMLAIPAKRNPKMEQRDSERLALLTGKPKEAIEDGKKAEASKQSLDLDGLHKSRGWSCSRSALGLSSISALSKNSSSKLSQQSKSTSPAAKSPSLSVPRLGCGITGDVVDFSQPIKKRASSAKLNAIRWAKEKGGIKAAGNANKIGESREKIEASAKRKREEVKADDAEEGSKKICSKSDKFKELMEMTSAHEDLVEKADDNEKEKYFNKLEAKERMEEKMMNTFKVECKAVKCLICKYTSFSASDMCKEKCHPLRVIDATKSFFKCADCGNRTVSLDKLPSYSCQKCAGSRWLRAAMMDERKVNITESALSIRGGEEKFIGSVVKNTSINLLVPNDES